MTNAAQRVFCCKLLLCTHWFSLRHQWPHICSLPFKPLCIENGHQQTRSNSNVQQKMTYMVQRDQNERFAWVFHQELNLISVDLCWLLFPFSRLRWHNCAAWWCLGDHQVPDRCWWFAELCQVPCIQDADPSKSICFLLDYGAWALHHQMSVHENWVMK